MRCRFLIFIFFLFFTSNLYAQPAFRIVDSSGNELNIGSDGTLPTSGGGSASALSDLTDVNSSTVTSGNLLIANGRDFDSVTMSGDCTIDSVGAITCPSAGVSALGDLSDINSSTATRGALIVGEGTGFGSITTLYIDPWGDNNIGIGTTNPQYTLQVVGTINADGLVLDGAASQTVLSKGLIVNNDSGTAATDDTEIKSGTLTVIDVTAGTDTLTGLGIWDLGGATSTEIKNGSTCTPTATGQICIDSTADQYRYYGSSTTRNLSPFDFKSVTIENLAAADDDLPFFSPSIDITLTKGWCQCTGTCTTEADIYLDVVEQGTAGPTENRVEPPITCEDLIAGDSAVSFTLNASITALDQLKFSVNNTPSPETDNYIINVEYTINTK